MIFENSIMAVVRVVVVVYEVVLLFDSTLKVNRFNQNQNNLNKLVYR